MEKSLSVGQEYADRRFRGDGHNPRVVTVDEVHMTFAWIKNNVTGRRVMISKRRLLNPSRFELVVAVPEPSPEVNSRDLRDGLVTTP